MTKTEILLTTHPDRANDLSTKIGNALLRVAGDPKSAEKFRETRKMAETAPVPGGGAPSGPNDSNALLRAVMAASSETGKSEGRAVTRLQIVGLTSIISVLWVLTLALGGVVWGDLKAAREKADVRIERLEQKAQDISVFVNTLQQRDAEKDRRLDKIDAKQDLTIQKIEELKDEIRKPK